MTVVEHIIKGVWLVWCGMMLVEAQPWRRLEVRDRQACGDQLADIMSLVCSGRGYNVAFRPERSSARRFRRGIVDECCRKSCTRTLLEQYCKPETTDAPSSVPIRKRSDGMVSSELLQMEDVSKQSRTEAETKKAPSQENNTETTPIIMKEGEGHYKLINLLAPPQKHNTRSSNNKITPNDTQEEFYTHNNPHMRHKSHHHNMRQTRNRKASTKTKRAKDVSVESSETFQIGMVKPYFAGRALRSNYVHHSDLS